MAYNPQILPPPISATGVHHTIIKKRGCPRVKIYGFAFGEAAHARQTASILAVCRAYSQLSCIRAREAALFFVPPTRKQASIQITNKYHS